MGAGSWAQARIAVARGNREATGLDGVNLAAHLTVLAGHVQGNKGSNDAQLEDWGVPRSPAGAMGG
jgi:hypothetical protein